MTQPPIVDNMFSLVLHRVADAPEMFGASLNKYLVSRCMCGRAGTNIDKHGALPDTRCDKPCVGDSSRTCGGNESFQAFQFAKNSLRRDYIGCFSDEACDRIFSKKETFVVSNSPEVRDGLYSKTQAAR